MWHVNSVSIKFSISITIVQCPVWKTHSFSIVSRIPSTLYSHLTFQIVMNNTSIHHNLHNHLVVFAHQRKQERVFTDEPQTPHCFRFSLRTCSSPQKLFRNKNRTRLPPLMFSHDNSKALNKQSDTNGKVWKRRPDKHFAWPSRIRKCSASNVCAQ